MGGALHGTCSVFSHTVQIHVEPSSISDVLSDRADIVCQVTWRVFCVDVCYMFCIELCSICSLLSNMARIILSHTH